jgi:hypothetical protein
MAKIKFDVKQIKEIVTTRYEIMALAVAGLLVVVCVILGFSKFVSASSPEKKILEDEASLSRLRQSGDAGSDSKDDVKPTKGSGWTTPVPGKDYLPLDEQPYFESGAAGESRREQPKILLVNTDPERDSDNSKSIQVDYIHRPVFFYDVDNQGKLRLVKGGFEPSYNIPSKHLVVVSATFPYNKQCDEFVKALHMENVNELFQKGLQPTFEGLIVERCDVTLTPDGKVTEGKWTPIYWQDKDGKPMTTEAIQNLLKNCLYDVENAESYKDVIYGQTVTPVPFLVGMGVAYPEIKIGKIDERVPAGPSTGFGTGGKKDGLAGMPGTTGGWQRPFGQPRYQIMPAPRAADPGFDSKDVDQLPNEMKDLKEQLKGNLNWFDANGFFPELPDDAKDEEGGKNGDKQKGAKQPDFKGPGDLERPKGKGGFGRPPGPPGPPGPGFPMPSNPYGMDMTNVKAPQVPPKNPNALIRFVDVDVKPGQSYKYRFKVLIANPNYKLSTKYVLNSDFAKAKLFETPGWAVTKIVTVPEEYAFFVINQEKGFVTKAGGKNAIDRDTGPQSHDKVAFQIHKYVEDTAEDGTKRQVSDWVICERLLVARGEALGRGKVGEKVMDLVEVELVVWNKTKNVFELATGVPGKEKLGAGMIKGIPVDFRPRQAIFLLDFAGGNKQRYTITKTTAVEDDSACEALLLMPDGTLVVRNSRNDMNDGSVGAVQANPMGAQRKERLDAWKKRLDDLRQQPPTTKTMPPGGGS